MAKMNLKAKAKKTLAVLSTAALILSFATAGITSNANAAELENIAASAEVGAPTKMVILDRNGKDITDNPIVYIDNTSFAGGNYYNEFTAKVTDDKENAVSTDIVVSLEAQPKGVPHAAMGTIGSGKGTRTMRVYGLEVDEKGKEKNYIPGTTHVYFSAADGTLYRTVTVVVYGPALDAKMYWGNKTTQLGVNDFNEDNSINIQAIANHQYPIYHEFLSPKDCTDVMEYTVYDGYYDGTGVGKPTDKAEISQSGIFTPKKNGSVTIVAKAKATETSDRFNVKGEKKVYRYNEKTNKIETTTLMLPTMPKYLHIFIAKENPAKAINITNPISALEANEKYQFEYYAEPTYSKEQGYDTGATDVFRWESSDPSIATVDEKGLVTALKRGDVKIRVYAENENVYSECDIRVLTKATSISLPQSFTTRVGITEQITATMSPTTADDEIVWSSSDESIATIAPVPVTEYSNKQTANITGVKKGTVIITARAKNSGVEAKRTINVEDRIATDLITFSTQKDSKITVIPHNSSINVFTTKSIVIDARLTDSNNLQSDDTVTWSASNNTDNKYAVLTPNGNSVTIQGVSAGSIVVTATPKSNKAAKKSFTVNVLKSSEIVTIYNAQTGEKMGSSKSLQINKGISLTAKLTISGNYPDRHDDTVKSWYSSNPDIAVVDNKGNVIGKSNGYASIIVETESGLTKNFGINVFSTSSVTLNNVTPPQNGETMPTASISMNNILQGSLALKATVKNQLNTAVSDADLVWSSSNTDVATVTDKGVVKALDVGTTVITVESGPQKQSCLLTVYAPLSTKDMTTVNGVTTFATAIDPYLFTPGVDAYEPHPEIYVGNNKLMEGKDYTLSYISNKEANNTATKVIAYGTGFYKGSITIPFKITTRPITDDSVTISDIPDQECIGSKTALTPVPDIYCGGTKLILNYDFKISYSNNYLPGIAKATITGMKNYSGKVEKEFVVFCNHKVLKDVKVIEPATYESAGSEQGTCTACGAKGVIRVIPILGHTENPAGSLSFEKSEIGLGKGETMTLTVNGIGSVDESAPITDTFRWESSDNNIVSITDNGTVKGIRKGTATITAYGELDDVMAKCTVTVLENKIKTLEISPNPAETRVTVSKEIKVFATPEKTDDEIIWEIQDPQFAEITVNNGKSIVITGKVVGTTKIIARGKYSGVEAETDLTVSPRNVSDLITISANVFGEQTAIPTGGDMYEQEIFTNQDIVFTSNLSNENGDKADDTTVWSITENDAHYVTLPGDKSGQELNPNEEHEAESIKIHGASEGSVIVTAYSKKDPNVKASFKLNVIKRCNSIAIMTTSGDKISSKSLDVSDSIQLDADLTTYNVKDPYDHDDAVKIWTSSDPTVATVTPTGYVTAVKNGKTTITVTTKSNQTKNLTLNVFTTTSIYITNKFNITDPPTLIVKVDKTTFQGYVNVSAKAYNENESSVSGASYKWFSSNENVAVVNENGRVTATGVGETEITVRSGSHSDSCLVEVIAPIDGIVLEPIPDQVYSPNASEYIPDLPRIFVWDAELVPDEDYTYEFINNTKKGKATLKITGQNMYTGTKSLNFNIVAKNIAENDVDIVFDAEQQYTGKSVEPQVVITYDGVELVKGTDYSVSYSNNKNESTAENPAIITISGKGNYQGTVVKEFNIVKTVKGMYGDVDGDNSITSADSLLILRRSINLEKFDDVQDKLSDVDNDGQITSADSLAVLRKSVGFDDGNKAGKEYN